MKMQKKGRLVICIWKKNWQPRADWQKIAQNMACCASSQPGDEGCSEFNGELFYKTALGKDGSILGGVYVEAKDENGLGIMDYYYCPAGMVKVKAGILKMQQMVWPGG